jgi:small subunit ribosomal protein S24e
MEITITKDIQNDLLSRKEVEFTTVYTGATPSRKMIHAKLAAILNVPKDQMVLDSLKTRFGLMQLSGSARIYESKDEMQKVEREYLLKRGQSAEDESEADAQDAPSGDAAEAS